VGARLGVGGLGLGGGYQAQREGSAQGAAPGEECGAE
jgi:hypothetical protein